MAAVAAAAALPPRAAAFFSGQPPAFVLGQSTFSGAAANQGLPSAGANTLNQPFDVFCDGARLFIADVGNNRVLIYNSVPTTTNAPADIAVGQPNLAASDVNQGLGAVNARTLNAPSGVFYDGTRLFVADASNSRVLIYNALPSTHNAAADIAVGQPHLNTGLLNQDGSLSNVTARSLNTPARVMVSGGRLVVADTENNRTLIYDTVPSTHNAPAAIAIGQPGLATNAAAVSATGGEDPTQALIAGGKLLVVEPANNRTLIYNSVPSTHNAAADVVIGQTNFTTKAFGSGANGLGFPLGLAVDQGRLFVTEHSNRRVLVYKTIPSQNNQSADIVIGQAGIYPGRSGPLPHQMREAWGVTYCQGHLFVAERLAHRVTAYKDTFGLYQTAKSTVQNSGVASFTVLGDDLLAGSTVALTGAGKPTIPSIGLVLASTGISAQFDLTGAPEGDYDLVITSGASRFTLASFVNVESFRVTQVIPNFGYNNTSLSFSVLGTNFLAGSSVTLTRSGEPDIAATGVVVVSTTEIQGTLDLKRRKIGLWTLTVSSGATAKSLVNGYLVTTLPTLSVDVERSLALGNEGGEVLVDSSANGLVGTLLRVPAGAIPSNITVTISVGAVRSHPPLPAGFLALQTPVDLAPSGMQFLANFALRIPFSASALRSFGVTDPSRLSGLTLNSESGSWEPVATTVDAANSTIELASNHFSAFVVAVPAATDFDSVKVFPNPFRPDLGHTTVQLTGLPANTRLALFTAAGEAVRDLGEAPTGAASWDGRSDAGQPAASGVYLLLLRQGSRSATRKVVVER